MPWHREPSLGSPVHSLIRGRKFDGWPTRDRRDAIIARIVPHITSLPFSFRRSTLQSTFADPFSEIVRSARMHLLDRNGLFSGRFGPTNVSPRKDSFNLMRLPSIFFSVPSRDSYCTSTFRSCKRWHFLLFRSRASTSANRLILIDEIEISVSICTTCEFITMIGAHLPRSPCRSDLAIVISVPRNHQRRARFVLPAKLIHKGNEVIGRDLEFGIGTIARTYDEDTGDDDDGRRTLR